VLQVQETSIPLSQSKHIHPGNTLEDVINTMGFAPIVPDNVPFTEPPTDEQLRIIREEIDPAKMYLG
jgi:glutaconate CoA-transferase subunit B